MWCGLTVQHDAPGSTPRSVWRTGWGIGFLGMLASATPLVAQPTRAGTRIVLSAQVSYQTASGQVITVLSDSTVMVVGQIGGVDLDPPGVSAADPGNTVVFVHTLRNAGNGVDSFTVVGRSQSGWNVRIYRDANGSGAVDPGDPLATAPIVLDAGESARLLLAADVPAQPTLRGKTDTIHVTGTSLFDRSIVDQLIDQTQIRGAGIAVTLAKSVDRSSASIGEILTYTVRYAAEGTSRATNVRIVDAIPLGATYVPGTLRLNGAALTDGAGDDAGTFDVLNNRVVVALASVAGGESGSVTFQVRVGR